MRIGSNLKRLIAEGAGNDAISHVASQITLTESEIKRPWENRVSLQTKLRNCRDVDVVDLWENLIGSVNTTARDEQGWEETKQRIYGAQQKASTGLPLSEAEVMSNAFQLLTQAKLFTTMQAVYELTPAVYTQFFGTFDSPYKEYNHQIPSDAPTADYVPEGGEYPTGQLVDRYCKTKANKFGRRIELSRETLIADKTGQVVEQAESLAASVKYREDELAALCFADSANSSLIPDANEADTGCYYPEGTRCALYRTSAGTTKATYETSINKKTGDLVSWNSIAAHIQLLRAMQNRRGQYIETVGGTITIVVPFGLEQRAGLLTAIGAGALTVISNNRAADTTESIETRAPNPIQQLGVQTVKMVMWNKLTTANTPEQSTWYTVGSMVTNQFWKHQRWATEFSRATQAQLGGDDFKRDIVLSVRGGFNAGFRAVDDKYVIQGTHS
jgi:hypothetical protein